MNEYTKKRGLLADAVYMTLRLENAFPLFEEMWASELPPDDVSPYCLSLDQLQETVDRLGLDKTDSYKKAVASGLVL